MFNRQEEVFSAINHYLIHGHYFYISVEQIAAGWAVENH